MSIKGWRALLLAAVAGAVMWAGIVAGISWLVSDDCQPDSPAVQVVPCPTEDACAVDYRDGAWHITEVTP